MADPDYGLDLSCTTDLDPMLRTVSGPDMMAQVCVRRLYCRRGNLLSDPNDDTIDARDLLSDGMTPKDLSRIQGIVTNVLLADERIFSVTVQATFNQLTRALILAISGVGALGPFTLTLSVSALTVELLRPQ